MSQTRCRPAVLGVTAALLAVTIACLAPRIVQASCGLDACPIVQPDGEAKKPGDDIGTTVVVPPLLRFTSFSIADSDGSYVEAILRGEYRGLDGWVFGAAIPLTMLDVDDQMTTGFGNLVALAEWTHRNRGSSLDLHLGVGAQLEIPVGDRDSGIASSHFEVMPYGTVTAILGRPYVFANLGFRQSLDSGHGHGDVMMVVNPHSDQELTYRAGVGTVLGRRGSTLALFVDGQQVFNDHHADATRYVNAGVETSLRVNQWMALRIVGELPITSPSRYDWRAGLGANLRF